MRGAVLPRLAALLRGDRLNIKRWHVAGAIALAACASLLVLGSRLSSGEAGPGEDSKANVSLPPLPWEAQAEPATPTPKAPRKAAVEPALPPVQEKPAPVDPKTGLPAASAGTNGSFTPPPPGERRHVYTATHRPDGPNAAERSALMINNEAMAPLGAPDPIRDAINAANLIVNQPYRLGGGHGSFRSKGYDCSGAVSYALAGAGLLGAPATSGQLMSWGVPGKGRWLTIYANPGHVYAVIAGLRWDTVGNARGSGPRWHPLDAYPQGYVARHLPGL